MKTLILTSALAAAFTLSACESYAGGHALAPVGKMATSAGEILTDKKGMSLYVFDEDSSGVSNCNGGCAQAWPPLAAPADADEASGFTAIKRADGTMQWAFKNQPLYYWQGDRKAGDVTGDGVGGTWHLARP